MLVHLEHADLVFAAKDRPELVISQDLALVLRVLEIVGLDVLPNLLTTSVRGRGDEPTTAASSFEGCSGFISAGFGFLSFLASAIVKLLCYAVLPLQGEGGRTMTTEA